MAKDRQGSVNVYGPLQAKTAEGIVAYTDGIFKENEDGSKTPLDKILSKIETSASGIKEVEELPKGATTVPNTGLVKELYFNTELAPEEVIKILDNITLLSQEEGYYDIFVYDDYIYELYITKNVNTDDDGNDYSQYNIWFDINDDVEGNSIYYNMFSYPDEEYLNEYGDEMFVGWNTAVDYPLIINKECTTLYEEVGIENDKLSSLVSTTPFKIDSNYIYKLKHETKGGIKGNLLVSNQDTYVEKIIINKTIPYDKVYRMLSNLEYGWVNTYSILFKSIDNGPSLYARFIGHIDEVPQYALSCIYSGDSYNYYCDIYRTDEGWMDNISLDIVNTNYEDKVEITINNYGMELHREQYQIGTQNDTLTTLVSMNEDFVEIKGELSYDYYVYDGKGFVSINKQQEPIIDVNELPVEGWKGTTVPNSGLVEKVYFNTEMSVDEVKETINRLDLIGPSPDYLGTILTNDNNVIAITKSTDSSVLMIINRITMEVYFTTIKVEEEGINFIGWNPNIVYPLNINAEVFDDDEISVCSQNNLISDLFSTTPFEKETINDKVIYRLNEVNYKGAPLPTDDTIVENLYFNTNLSIEETVKILEENLEDKLNYDTETNLGSLALTPVNGGDNYRVYTNSYIVFKSKIYNSWAIVNLAYALQLQYPSATINGEPIIMFSSAPNPIFGIALTGWNKDIKQPIEYNSNSSQDANKPTKETYEKLSFLISSTPFEEEEISSSYHVYKEGKWTQLSGTKNPQLFTVVDELPKEIWKGTPVPNSDYVDTLYFNTNLTIKKVTDVLSKLTYSSFEGFGENLYPVFFNAEGSLGVGIAYIEEINAYMIVNNEGFPYFTSVDIEGFKAGWNGDAGNNLVVISDNIVSQMTSINENDILSSIISTTPFVKEELPKNVDKIIYKVKDTKEVADFKGTAVPNEGIVEKIYFNINLNKEEVFKLIKELPYVQLREGINSYIVFADTFDLTLSSGNFVIVNNEIDTGTYQILASVDGALTYIYNTNNDDDSGWNNGTEFLLDGVEYNSNSIMSIASSQLGQTMVNEKLSKLFSITPFEEVINLIPTGTYSYYTYNGKEFVRLDGGNNKKEILDFGEVELKQYNGGRAISTIHYKNIEISNEIAQKLLNDSENIIIKIKTKITEIESGNTFTVFYQELLYPTMVDQGIIIGNLTSNNKQIVFSNCSSIFKSNFFETSFNIVPPETTSFTLDYDGSSNKYYATISKTIFNIASIDEEPVRDSKNMITSGAVYRAIVGALGGDY